MISKKNFEKNFIEKQSENYPNVDPQKLEMTIFAFGLLDELIRSELPLIFKGGTSLLLLLDKPKRVSTDIDIIVPKNTNFDKFFEKVKTKFPFYEGEERGENTNSFFRHFYFMFRGPTSQKECRINLDVAFEENPYPRIIRKELSLPFVVSSKEKTYVNIPTHESILGDKLTAFAPTTIGVNPYATSLGKPIDNRLQVMKQFYDIAQLSDFVINEDEIMESYIKCHEFENSFRKTNYSIVDTLLDTFNHAAEIASMGRWNKKSNFYCKVARPGMQGLATNIFDGKYNQNSATIDASKVMRLVSRLITRKNFSFKKLDSAKTKLQFFKSVSDIHSFALIREAIDLIS